MENLLHPLHTIASFPLVLDGNTAGCKYIAVIEETGDPQGLRVSVVSRCLLRVSQAYQYSFVAHNVPNDKSSGQFRVRSTGKHY